MSFLRRLFEPSQLKDCRFALKAYANRFERELAWPQVEQFVSSCLSSERNEVRSRMILERHSAKDIVGDMIANTCLNNIESGQFHTYRGVLGMHGQSQRNIFAGVVTEQLKDGWITIKEVAIANENMKRAIAEAG